MKTYFEKYVQYLDSLSPEELNTSRYRGQREQAVAMYETVSREQGVGPKDLSDTQNPLLSLFQILEEMEFFVDDQKAFQYQYSNKVEPLLLNDYDELFQKQIENSLERFDALQKIISSALSGNEKALVELEELVPSAAQASRP